MPARQREMGLVRRRREAPGGLCFKPTGVLVSIGVTRGRPAFTIMPSSRES